MALIEEFENQGSTLFRYRSYVPLVIILISIFFLPDYKYPGYSYESHLIYGAVCFGVSIFGLIIRCITIGYAPGRTSGRNTKEQIADVVNQTGIYSLIRHPLYVGNFFMFFGIVLFLMSLSMCIVFILFYWFYYERIMFTEEQFLRKKFGDEYLAWANKTPALIPNFKNYRSPSLSFSFRNILKREYAGLFGVVVFFTLYDLAMIYFNEPELGLNAWPYLFKPVHAWFFGAGLIFYVIIRIIVKTTKLLEVEGR
ncbi:MAG: lipid A Kdo2 1-phosphate O-methyltransferase [Leptospira sp.]|nr:lipid A Kdo2 1-phosphate O-methyltransferase [Leptospira sp.]